MKDNEIRYFFDYRRGYIIKIIESFDGIEELANGLKNNCGFKELDFKGFAQKWAKFVINNWTLISKGEKSVKLFTIHKDGYIGCEYRYEKKEDNRTLRFL